MDRVRIYHPFGVWLKMFLNLNYSTAIPSGLK